MKKKNDWEKLAQLLTTKAVSSKKSGKVIWTAIQKLDQKRDKKSLDKQR